MSQSCDQRFYSFFGYEFRAKTQYLQAQDMYSILFFLHHELDILHAREKEITQLSPFKYTFFRTTTTKRRQKKEKKRKRLFSEDFFFFLDEKIINFFYFCST